MPIDRTNFNQWVDDDGSGTTGTVLFKDRMALDILDPIDVALAVAPTLPATCVLGRGDASPGPAEPLAIGEGLAVVGTTLVCTVRNSGIFGYQFATPLTEPPSARTVRCNAGHPYTAVTKVWVTFLNSAGEDLYWGWMRVPVGSRLLIQDKDTHAQYAEFTVTAPPIDKGSYAEVPVTWFANGTALATQDCLVRSTAPDDVLALFSDLRARVAALEAAR